MKLHCLAVRLTPCMRLDLASCPICRFRPHTKRSKLRKTFLARGRDTKLFVCMAPFAPKAPTSTARPRLQPASSVIRRKRIVLPRARLHVATHAKQSTPLMFRNMYCLRLTYVQGVPRCAALRGTSDNDLHSSLETRRQQYPRLQPGRVLAAESTWRVLLRTLLARQGARRFRASGRELQRCYTFTLKNLSALSIRMCSPYCTSNRLALSPFFWATLPLVFRATG